MGDVKRPNQKNKKTKWLKKLPCPKLHEPFLKKIKMFGYGKNTVGAPTVNQNSSKGDAYFIIDGERIDLGSQKTVIERRPVSVFQENFPKK